jgi:hypothetical protein
MDDGELVLRLAAARKPAMLRALVVGAFVLNGRNLARTAQALGISLSTLKRLRSSDEVLTAELTGTPGRPAKERAHESNPKSRRTGT